jgi:aminoglycoside 6'-N-acetyltransferase I
METVVRPVERKDAAAWLSLRRALWPEGEHEAEIEEFFAGRSTEPLAVLIAEDAERPLGFAELSIRSHADGCRTNRIGYLEGWYVAPAARRRGVGRALVRAGEDWARSRGCTEFASDTRPDNAVSIAAHKALAFADAGQLQCFRKDL